MRPQRRSATMFELSISIEATALNAILNAGENICIVLNAKAVVTSAAQASSGASSAQRQVLWQALPPYPHNLVQWEADQWSLFVADNADPGSTLVITAPGRAVDGRTVRISDGEFGEAGGSLPLGCYGAQNMNRDWLAVGLACSATVNGRATPSAAALAVCIVPRMQYVQLTPGATVQVFLQSQTNTGMVLPNPIDSVERHLVDSNGGTLALSYDSASARFVEQVAAA